MTSLAALSSGGSDLRDSGLRGPDLRSDPLRGSGLYALDPAHADPGREPRSSRLGIAARRALGGLLPLLDDPGLRDLHVQVRQGRGALWVDRGGGLARVEGWSTGAEAVERFARDLIAAGGRHLDELAPAADVSLGEGIRVHAVLPPVAASGAAVSIRVPSQTIRGFDELVGGGLCTPEQAEWLAAAVTGRKNILISGGTGSGKTTLLAALLDLAGPGERIVTIEDVAELRLAHENVVALESRQPNAEGIGGFELDRLLREALRMRPDRIVLGECRGAEVVTMLSALNTGHDGGAGTIHASALGEVPTRLEALGALGGLAPVALARQAVSAVHAIVHLEKRGGMHRVAAIGALGLDERGMLSIQAVRTKEPPRAQLLPRRGSSVRPDGGARRKAGGRPDHGAEPGG